jgi:hypothetical protein
MVGDSPERRQDVAVRVAQDAAKDIMRFALFLLCHPGQVGIIVRNPLRFPVVVPRVLLSSGQSQSTLGTLAHDVASMRKEEPVSPQSRCGHSALLNEYSES